MRGYTSNKTFLITTPMEMAMAMAKEMVMVMVMVMVHAEINEQCETAWDELWVGAVRREAPGFQECFCDSFPSISIKKGEPSDCVETPSPHNIAFPNVNVSCERKL